MKKLIVGYVRISSKDSSSNSISNQILLIKDYCKNKNISVDKFYVDDGKSGLNFERDGFNSLKYDIEKGLIATIIVKDISRLGREMFESSFYINEFFKLYNIKLIAVDEEIDDVYAMIKSIVNDNYAKEASRMRKSVAALKTLNHEFIGPYAPFGYKICHLNKLRTLEIDLENSSVIKMIFKMYLSKRNIQMIAEYLNDNFEDKTINWTARKIREILKNPVYKGALVVRKSTKENYKDKKRSYIKAKNYEIIENVFPKIIDKNTFYKVGCLLRKYNSFGVVNHKINLQVKCGYCLRYMRSYCRVKDCREQHYFKCLSCNKTIFLSKITKIIKKKFIGLLDNLDIQRFLLIKFNQYKKKILSNILYSIDMLDLDFKDLYFSKVQGRISEEEFLLLKTKLDLNYKKLKSKYNCVDDFKIFNINMFIDSLDLFDFVKFIEVNDALKIYYKFR